MKLINNVLVLMFCAFFLFSFNTVAKKAKDFLSIGKQMTFEGEDYFLEWSSHPSETYYIQEYLRKQDNLHKFNKMLMVSVINADVPVKEAVAFKVAELEEQKKTNPVINYEVFTKDGESIIDFVISDKAYIYEWNLQRYQKQDGKLVLLSYVYRDSLNTQEDLFPFFDHIKKNRHETIGRLGEFDIPKVKLK